MYEICESHLTKKSYLTFHFKSIFDKLGIRIKDDSVDIPIELNVREVCDDKGNTVDFESKGGKIIIPKEKNEKVEEVKNDVKQEISNFEKNDVELLESIEEIIISSGNIELLPEDELIYEIEHNNILEVLDDGTMIPKNDGTTTVRIKLNGNVIGTQHLGQEMLDLLL